MDTQKRTIIIYKTSEKKEPFTDWLRSIKDKNIKNRILARIDRLQLGNLGDYKSISDGIFELRLHFGPGYRIYCGESEKVIIILLCAGDKSSQETDIEKAKEYFNKYKEQKDDEI